MIMYNVTLSVNPAIEVEFIDWLKNIHIPEVIDTGLFLEWNVFRVLEQPEAKESNSYAVQYKLESWQKFHEYQENHAPALKQKTQDKYGENVLAFRSFLETV